MQKVEHITGINFIGQTVEASNPDSLRKICFMLKNDLNDFLIVLAADINGKPHVAIMVDDNVNTSKNLDASKIIKEIVAPIINGGGGGQKTFATAGGKLPGRLFEVISQVKALL